MRHKYTTGGVVLARTPLREAGMLITLLTPDLGLVRARAEGVRRSGAKLAHALQTLCQSRLMLVRGREGWRITGAALDTNRFLELPPSERARVARVAQLLIRLVHDESNDPALHDTFTQFVTMLPTLSKGEGEIAELLVVLRLLATLGLVREALPPPGYDASALRYGEEHRSELISRINRGITASGL